MRYADLGMGFVRKGEAIMARVLPHSGTKIARTVRAVVAAE